MSPILEPEREFEEDSQVEDFELKVSRCRAQIHSRLENQKNLALILSAVEENIEQQGNKKTPIAYFVSFLALLDQSLKHDMVVEANVASAAAYFLDMTIPFLAKSLLRQEFPAILSKLAPILSNENVEAPLVRSSIGALEGLLLAQDSRQWLITSNVSPRRALMGMLELSFDLRPKVRKRAQEAILKILRSPPTSPSPIHPAADLCAEISRKKLESLLHLKSNSNRANKDQNSTLIHTLQVISVITSTNSWPTNQAESLCTVLLSASKTSDKFVVTAAFNAFHGLFASMSHDMDIGKFTSIFTVIMDLKPSLNDTHLAVAWLAVVANCFLAFAKLLPKTALKKIPEALPVVAEFISSETEDIYSSASQSFIAILCEGIPDSYLFSQESLGIHQEVTELVCEVISFTADLIEKALFSIKYQHAISVVIDLVIASVNKFKALSNPDLLGILEVVGNWRSNEEFNFPHNRKAEELVSVCIRHMGPEVVLNTLPLNLTGVNKVGRAWLLPILRDNVRSSSLNYYQREILPISETFKLLIEKSVDTHSMQCKIFQTIIDQIWSLFPRFCDLPTDLEAAFTDNFASYLSETLYTEVNLRVVICNGLKTLVESNLLQTENLLSRESFCLSEVSVQNSKRNTVYLSSKASNVLSVLFNVFSSTMPEARGCILDTIDSFLRIVPVEDLEVSFNKVCTLLKQALDDENANPKRSSAGPILSVTMMDLIVAMAKYVPQSCFNALFSVFARAIFMFDNALMQKRSYRIVTKLSESESGISAIKHFHHELQKTILETSGSSSTSSRAARLSAIQEIVRTLPADELNFISSVLQEVIMSTKDVNEKSREQAYSLLIQMGKKMQKGGSITSSDPTNLEQYTTDANLKEYFAMVSAGLAAQSPHMISAAITAISCIVYEFKDDISHDVLIEIASTVELFLTHNSREIAKAAIGFIKVEILALPSDFVEENLGELLAKLMKWSHEHKGHFKSKVKHIIERLIRKFGFEIVEQAIPAEDRKLVANIKKSRSRAKRKEAFEAPVSSGGEPRFMSAFEEVVYDSDSEHENDIAKNSQPTPRKRPEKFILNSGDDPLDLLDQQVLAHISSSKPKEIDKSHLKYHEFAMRNGKFVFRDSASNAPESSESGIDAYLDAVKQAPVRSRKNKLKFKKSHRDDDWSDSENMSVPKVRTQTKSSNSKVTKPKQRFKARKKL